MGLCLPAQGGAGLILGQGAKTSHAWGPKKQSLKQKQCCNKFNKGFTLEKKSVREKLRIGDTQREEDVLGKGTASLSKTHQQRVFCFPCNFSITRKCCTTFRFPVSLKMWNGTIGPCLHMASLSRGGPSGTRTSLPSSHRCP